MVNTLIITFVLDETGSMESIKDDTIGGFNAYIDGLKRDRHSNGGEIEFSLIKFDSNRVDKVCIAVPIEDVAPLTADSYKPGAATPLIDAAYKAIKATEEAVAKRSDSPKILCVIQTDGYENASKEFKMTDLTMLIKEKRSAGWEFIFLGAGLDAFAIANQMGIHSAVTMAYATANSLPTFDSLVSNTNAYRATGKSTSLDWSAAQRISSGDKYHDKHSKDDNPTTAVDDFSLEK